MTATTKAEKVAKTEQLLRGMLEFIREITSQALENTFRLCHGRPPLAWSGKRRGGVMTAIVKLENVNGFEAVVVAYATVDRLSRGQASDEEA